MFDNITVILSSTKYPTISQILPLSTIIDSKILKVRDSDLLWMVSLKEYLKERFEEYFIKNYY